MGSITPLLRIPSVRAVSLALAAPRQLATLLFFVANKPPAVCAYLVLGAAVPWHLYRLKCDKRNLDWQIICCFVVPFLGFSLLRAEREKHEGAVFDACFPIGDQFLLSRVVPQEMRSWALTSRVQSAIRKPAIPS
jgi:hypothetical protein